MQNQIFSSISTPVLIFLILIMLGNACTPVTENKEEVAVVNTVEGLNELFTDWRTFEQPPLKDRAPDYTVETFKSRRPAFESLRRQLVAIDTTGWPIPDQVDYLILWAEMNGYDFNEKILKPWSRDPAYYKSLWMSRSDVPAHEGPTHHGTTEFWTYQFPLSDTERERLLSDLRVIPPQNEQAKVNLTGNAKDLWIAGIRDIKYQIANLQGILKHPGIKGDSDLESAITEAIESSYSLSTWLSEESENKTGSSGLGKDEYTWYLQNVHLVPLTWADEVMILKRELSRAWSSLKLEEHRNRSLPQIEPVSSPDEYNALAEKSAVSLLNFLERDEIVTVKEYFEPALRAHLGSFVPEDIRNFFWITAHLDPRPLYSHFYHWFELARMDTNPHKRIVRREPLLYNIFDSRNEGTATAVEEMFMQAGLYDDEPRVREIVYIMIAQRAARGLGSLYAHANEMSMEEAGGIHTTYTPRGWMKTEEELRIFEQHLYLRQPGYGTSYITGKHLLEQAMAEYARIKDEKGEEFELKDFLDRLNSIGNIPIALGQWEMTGIDDDIRMITEQFKPL